MTRLKLSTVQWQKIEAIFLLTISILAVYYTGESWWWLSLILVPDVFMIGYLKDNTVGAFIYNLGHTFVFPALLLGAGLVYDRTLLLCFACVWAAHIGMDRTLGYGLKTDKGFKHTHLGDL